MEAISAIYPTLAAVAGESGTVVVEVKVKADGRVAEAGPGTPDPIKNAD